MKRKLTAITILALLPLIAAGIFELFGIIFSFWVYLILAIICPMEVGILWFMYKDMEKKIAEAKKEAERR